MNPITYMDMNIPIGPNSKEICETAIRYGYKILALNTPILASDCSQTGTSKKVGKKRKWEERAGGIVASTAATIRKNQPEIPIPVVSDWEKKLMTENPGVRILKRLTVIFSELNELQIVLKLPNIKFYDVLAVIPTNSDALQSCIITTSLMFDIISFDLEGPHWIKFIKLNKLKGNLAQRRDLFFEITYASSMHGDIPLENMVYLANRLSEDICIKKIKSLIISSGAATSLELRSPKDTSSLAFLLGLDETTARHCIREHAHRILNKSDARKAGKTWVAFTPGIKQDHGESSLTSEADILPSSQKPK